MFNNEGYSLADIAAAASNGRVNNDMFGGGFGGNGWWIILLFLFAFGGWGNGGWGNNGADAAAMLSGSINNGFNNAAIQSSLGDISTSLCANFANAAATTNNSQALLSQQLYANQITDLERSFTAQAAIANSMNTLQSQLAQCCCDNRLATTQLGATIAQENCADRQTINDATREILASNNAGIQRILDQMCQDRIDSKNERIADLERQLTLANLSASQTAQTSRLLADNQYQTSTLEQYLAPVPRPAYIVQNPNTGYYGCGCSTLAA